MAKEIKIEAEMQVGSSARITDSVVNCGHTERGYYAKGQCRRCYQKVTRKRRQIRKREIKRIQHNNNVASQQSPPSDDERSKSTFADVLPEALFIPVRNAPPSLDVSQGNIIQYLVSSGLLTYCRASLRLANPCHNGV